MRVFVAGGSGAIGRDLVPKLVAEGHDVVATARSSAKLAEIRASGAEAVVMDGLDPASVTAAITASRPEVIVHQMTALAAVTDLRHFDHKFAVTNRLRTEGTRYLLDAATKTGVRRLVAQGFTGWPNERDGSPVKDETFPLDPHPPRAMRQIIGRFCRTGEDGDHRSRGGGAGAALRELLRARIASAAGGRSPTQAPCGWQRGRLVVLHSRRRCCRRHHRRARPRSARCVQHRGRPSLRRRPNGSPIWPRLRERSHHFMCRCGPAGWRPERPWFP